MHFSFNSTGGMLNGRLVHHYSARDVVYIIMYFFVVITFIIKKICVVNCNTFISLDKDEYFSVPS